MTAQNLDAAIPAMTAGLQHAGATIQGPAAKTTVAGLPAFLLHATGTTSGSRYQSRLVFAFSGTTEYFVNCQYTPVKAAEMEQACNQVVGSLHVGRPGATQGTPQAPQAQPGSLAKQQAQGDLAALRQAGTFTSDLGTLTSDVRAAAADAAAAEDDATTLGTGCQVVSILTTDASTAGIDASTVRIDRNTLNADIGTAAQGVAALTSDLSTLSARGLPAPAEAAAAITTTRRAVSQAVRQANSEVDHVNAGVARVYSTAARMAASSCPSEAPGRAPVPISHISSK